MTDLLEQMRKLKAKQDQKVEDIPKPTPKKHKNVANIETPETPETPEEGAAYSPAEVDAFWDSVLSEEEGEGQAGFRGLTLQEARARGLIPTDFDPP